MLAVVEQGGKQYLVKENQVIKIEKILGEPGDSIDMGTVKCLIDGQKMLLDAGKVRAEIISQEKDEKLVIFKRRRRKNSRRKKGHRQSVTILRIKEVSV